MEYPSIQDYYDHIFDAIRSLVYDDTTKPTYESDIDGINQLIGVLERMQTNYYVDYYQKASYLFLSLSTGHYFKNGNKRVAIFSYVYFHQINKNKFKGVSEKVYRQWFKKHFPNYKLSKNNFKNNVGWAIYNASKVMNIKEDSHSEGHGYAFSELKLIVEEFIRLITQG